MIEQVIAYASELLGRDAADLVMFEVETSEPIAAPGGGFVHSDADAADLERLLETLDSPNAEELAAAAQVWRLPVLPYRRSQEPAPAPDLRVASAHDSVVVDLTAMWAGPLATKLLADAGARVVKIDPRARPDGMADAPWNDGKEIVDLDLRRTADRACFERLVSGADLVIDSFSPRVMPNLGYDPDALRAINSAVTSISMPAFGAGRPERDWVAYGGGIHAVAGLGDNGDGSYSPAPFSYPDPVAGITAFVTATAMLGTGSHVEVPLYESVLPLS